MKSSSSMGAEYLVVVVVVLMIGLFGGCSASSFHLRGRRDVRPSGPPCPAEWDITPCVCTGRQGAPTIDCSDVETADRLRQIFAARTTAHNFRGIDIHSSNLTSLPDDAFAPHNFYLFLLSGNKIRDVAAGAFKGSEKSADMIRLDGNQIVRFPFASLASLTSLRVLSLEQNQLSEIPADAFPKIATLEMVDLSDNKIASIGKNAFSGLTGLQKLDLANNQLTNEKVDETAFAGLKLINLDLSYNQLTVLNEKVFTPLVHDGTTIHVEGNPLNCADAGMNWLKNLAPDSKARLLNNPC